jgi:hypothetical protein
LLIGLKAVAVDGFKSISLAVLLGWLFHGQNYVCPATDALVAECTRPLNVCSAITKELK